jgi:PAS domain S-box-containing protein
VEKKTILIVEDEGILAVQMQNMLIELGYNVPEPVATGMAAIAAVTAEWPDMVLMDIKLTGMMDGVTAARRISAVADVPIVFLTGFSQDPLLQRAKTAAPYGYIVKPVSLQELTATIEMAFYRHTRDHQLEEHKDALQKAHDELELRVQERTAELRLANESLSLEIEEHWRVETALRESEERYRRITVGLTDYLYTVRIQDGRAMEMTHGLACETVTGYTQEEYAADPCLWMRMVMPEDQGRVTEYIRQTLAGEKSPPIEHCILHKDGKIRWVSNKLIPQFDSRGTLASYDGVIKDITDRMLAEKVLQYLSSRQEALLSAIPDIIMEVDSNKVYTWANQVGLDFFGEDVTGKEVAYYFEGEQDTYDVIDPLFRGEENVIYVRSWQRRKDGQKRLLAWLCRVLKDSAGKVTGAISTARDITERNLAEQTIARERTLSDNIINSLPGIFYKFDDQGQLIRWNRKFAEVTGYSTEELNGLHVVDLFSEAYKHYITLRVQSVFADGEALAEAPLLTKEGLQIPYLFTGQLTLLDGKQYLLGVGIDISERIRAEEEKDALQGQLLQAQKMESVGRLAGGVAHDFNNMLSAIIGHAELAMMKSSPSEPIRSNLKAIVDSAYRSADLTKQLLAFARKQTVAPKIIDVNEAVAGLLKMLLRLIGEDINVVWKPKTDLWQVKIDPTQIDQIMANLCVNARDAITGVGKVDIETENIAIDEAYCAFHLGFACGDYVMLAVSDDGCGMSKEVLDHIFEPFFTTKDVGKGTGLGLSTVYGIVKQNNGFINVYSEPDQGTTFKIYLPRFVGEAIEPAVERTVEMSKGHGETVLLVEDELVILDVSREMLEQLGYAVLIASTPREALSIAKSHAGEIQMLITDVVMPEMNGRDLAKLICDIRPGLKCLFISGYTADVIAHHGVLDPGVNFIQKPFSMVYLAVKVREVLESANGVGPPQPT